MTAILLAIHTFIVVALVIVVLLQRSEGGALGMGGGGGGGFMSGRGAANALTRTTTVLATIFFASSLLLALTADRGTDQSDILRELTGEEQPSRTVVPGAVNSGDLLDAIGSDAPDAAPQTQAPQTEAPLEQMTEPASEAAPETPEDE
ncbi:preprotein translocase subunit SecG [Parvularcula dongshanensis]|uniref:Protein-export membrane protein SecG n=1 Tax=Parvularcula dongshanensis TaxID=1173995 RepID=A0A840I6N5_9PROT|nr:preprotein translocase subunit SecG [Parvularcula dongshanensis]MBB4659903.1 preprotein translocase subunit SecG [Parvularcula dongshanensis]